MPRKRAASISRHPAEIVRAIHIEKRAVGDLWEASFPGDQWTRSKVFNPPMPLRQLKQQLLQSGETHGLPLVVFEYPPKGNAA